MRDLRRKLGNDLILAARPGRTHCATLKVSVGVLFETYAIAAPRKGSLLRHIA